MNFNSCLETLDFKHYDFFVKLPFKDLVFVKLIFSYHIFAKTCFALMYSTSCLNFFTPAEALMISLNQCILFTKQSVFSLLYYFRFFLNKLQYNLLFKQCSTYLYNTFL